MSDIALIYLIEQEPDVQQRFGDAARRLGCHLHLGGGMTGSAADICALRPHVVVVPARTEAIFDDKAEQGKLYDALSCRAALDATGLNETSLLLLLDELPAEAAWPMSGSDDFILRHAGVFEVTTRVHAALRLAQSRRQTAALRSALERQNTQNEASGYAQDTTTQLVEIAAELQAEVCHSAEREEASVREAQTDTIAQAAAALRHEINNPLFAILGSGESVLRRLHTMQQRTNATPSRFPISASGDIGADIAALIAGVERIQRGGERIEQVVQAISDMLTPATTDYMPGISMLNLNAPKTAA